LLIILLKNDYLFLQFFIKMSKLSGIRDLDREILGKLDFKDILNACQINKYTWNIVCDEAFLRRSMLAKYPQIERYKAEGETWKSFFIKANYYIERLKRFECEYIFGNFEVQYKIFKYYYVKNEVLVQSARQGELALVIWALKMGADIHFQGDEPLRYACLFGDLQVVKYLVEHGANIHFYDDNALMMACINGHLEIIKYLVEHGAKLYLIHALKLACTHGHLEVVKYFIKMGASINDMAIERAKECGHLKIVEFLESFV
jgi:hypothetical protein